LFYKIFFTKLYCIFSNFFVSNFVLKNFFIAKINDSTVCSSKNIPVTPSITVSNAPPFLYAITGLPQDCASKEVIPKSSS
jgi:hypothetical protein